MGIGGIGGLFVVASIAAFIAVLMLPLLVILHYVTKWKATKGLSNDEQRLLEDLWRDSDAMQRRLEALETILDDEVPEWRKRR
jgi:phage shock protein B